jgi:hypothetical protein
MHVEAGSAAPVFLQGPLRGEPGQVAGMFRAVAETTEKVLAERWLATKGEGLRRLFHQAPGFLCMLRGREHVFDLASPAFLQLVGHRDLVDEAPGFWNQPP